jgi:plastocyanin
MKGENMEKEEPKTHTANITVDSQGNFHYDPLIIMVDRRDTVVWKCEGNPNFAIHIGWNSPLDRGRYRTSKKEIKAHVQENAQPGHYHYFVAVLIDNEIWTDDPEIIVRRPSGG